MTNNVLSYVKDRWNKFTVFDRIRLYKLLEITQTIIIFVFLAILLAPIFDSMFPDANEENSTSRILLEVILQCIVTGLGVFYIEKLGRIIPPLPVLDKKFKTGTTKGYTSGIILSLAFVGLQRNLSAKLHILEKRIKQKYKLDKE